MINYVDKVNEKFVYKVASEFLTKKWFAKYVSVNKHGDVWKVIYKINNSYYTVLFNNFEADFGSQIMRCSFLDKAWQAAMFKKFGNEYYLDLSNFLNEKLKSTNRDVAQIARIELKAIQELKARQELKKNKELDK